MEQNESRSMEDDAPNPSDVSQEEPSLLDQQPIRDQPQQFTQQPSIQNFPTQPVKVDYTPSNIDELEELVESIINEKWRSLIENFGDIGLWREKVRTEVLSIKQELRRMEARFENLQRAVLGKITNYDENIKEVGSEVRALEQVFQKIMEPLTTNIKELEKVTKKLKEK